MLQQPLAFTGYASIQLFNSSPSSDIARLLRKAYHLLCSYCVTYGMPCHAIGRKVLATLTLA